MIKFRDYAETYAGRSQLGELKGCWNGMLFCLRIFFGKKYTEQNIGLLTYTCYDKYLHIIIFIKIYMLINQIEVYQILYQLVVLTGKISYY